MFGCSVQKYGYSPASVNVCSNVAPVDIIPESNSSSGSPLSPDVTVCCAMSSLVHVTVSSMLTSIGFGWYASSVSSEEPATMETLVVVVASSPSSLVVAVVVSVVVVVVVSVVVSSSVELIVPLAASLSIGPNVCPPSVLNLATGVSLVWFVSHQLTITSAPSAAISTLPESASGELLRFILSPNVCPASLEALNITSSLPFSVLLVHQAT